MSRAVEHVPRRPLAVAAVQPDCPTGDIALSARRHAQLVRDARSQLVIFPELSLTGYDMEAESIAVDDPRLREIVEACVDMSALALVGAPVLDDDGRRYIAVLGIDADGVRVAYRKMFLSSEESRSFAAGQRAAAVDLDGWRIGLGICKDTGIGVQVRETTALGIDVYAAGTVISPEEADEQDDRACRIATSHQVYVAFASWAGPTGGYERYERHACTDWPRERHSFGGATAARERRLIHQFNAIRRQECASGNLSESRRRQGP